MKNIYLFLLVLFVPSLLLVGQTKIYAPELSLPENGAINQMPNVELDWNAVTGGSLEIYYEVQLAEDTNFTNPVVFPLTLVTALNASELKFGDKYFWRVRAHDGDDVSDWSEIWSFNVLNTVEVNTPGDGDEVNPQVEIGWNAIDGANLYQLLVDTSFIWKKEITPFENSIRGVFVVNDNVYGGVGDDGLIFHWDNGVLSIDESGTTKDLLDVTSQSDEIWVVGDSGTVLQFTGEEWNSLDIGTTKDLYGVSFSDANNGWIVGKSGKVFHYDGTAWTEVSVGTSKDLYDVWALSATNVWAVGKSGTFVHYDGNTWDVSTPGTKDYLGLWFNNENDGWAVAKSGRYSHWDGSTWTEKNIGVSKILYGVAFKSDNEGYIVGASGNLFQYDGNEWKSITSGTTNDIYAINFNNDFGVYGGKKGNFYTYIGGDGFNSPYAKIFNINGGENTSFYMGNLIFGKTYYYKMRAAHSQDTSAWCDARSFMVQMSPELLSPSDGANDEQLNVLLDWKDFEGVLKYNISVADNPEFNNSFNSSSDSSSYLVTGLSFGKQYYWKVNAQHSTATSPWSKAWSFSTVNTVNLVSPADGATGVDPCPMVKWELIDGAASYEIWLDSTNTFTNPLIKVETSDHSQCQSPLEKGQTYYWKVRAVYALDTSGFSPVWSFTTKSPDGIEEEFFNRSLSVYPNPSQGLFNIKFSTLKAINYNITVMDVNGKVIYKRNFKSLQGENIVKLNLNDITSGIYYLNISGDNLNISRKITVQ